MEQQRSGTNEALHHTFKNYINTDGMSADTSQIGRDRVSPLQKHIANKHEYKSGSYASQWERRTPVYSYHFA